MSGIQMVTILYLESRTKVFRDLGVKSADFLFNYTCFGWTETRSSFTKGIFANDVTQGEGY